MKLFQLWLLLTLVAVVSISVTAYYLALKEDKKLYNNKLKK